MRDTPRLVLATENPHKVEEILHMVSGLDIDVATLGDYPGVTPGPETGEDFEANAAQKAEAVAAATGCWALADDSGLEVEALGGRPGVFSKRYAGPDASDSDNNRKLLLELAAVAPGERRARFVTVMALARPDEKTLMVRGEVEGTILEAPRGKTGFGYDPLFYYPPFDRSFGELPLEEKNRVSHRARAVAAMKNRLHHLLNGDPDRTSPGRVESGTASPEALEKKVRTLEYVEAVVVALIMALILREFFMEAFKIPTPSMAPTLRGQERLGDRILVDKFIYQVRAPRRWEIIVFRYPLNQNTNYIKRLVGLPGEAVWIVDGDIWINRRIERKPLALQDDLWISLFPGCRDPYGAMGKEYGLPGRFETSDGKGEWTGTWEAAPGPGRIARLRYAFQPEAGNFGDRSASVRFGAPAIGIGGYRDIRLSGTVTLQDAASTAAVEVTTRGVVHRVRFRAGGQGSGTNLAEAIQSGRNRLFTGSGNHNEPGAGRCLPVGKEVAVRVMYVDYQFIVEVDGEIWFRHVFEPRQDPDTLNIQATTLTLTLGEGGGRWADLAVARDLHHTTVKRFQVPEDSFLVLGDNSANSRDSRKWEKIRMHLKNGRIIEVEKDAPDIRFHPHTRLQTRYTDVLGNHYLPEEIDFDKQREIVAAPFVSRDQLIGRAFMVFFPWPPFYTHEFRPGLIR